MSEDVMIYNPLRDNVQTFNSATEFREFYNENKEEIDKKHTRTLNVIYKIDGYKIARSKGKMILTPTLQKLSPDEILESFDLLNEKIDIINKKYEKIERTLELICEQFDIDVTNASS